MIWDMSDEAFDKFEYRQCKSALAFFLMVMVAIGNGLAVIGLDARFTDRWSFQITSQILDVAVVIVGWFGEMNHPFFLE